MEVKLWVVLGALAVLFPIFVAIVRSWFNRILNKLDELIRQNSDHRTELVRQNERMSGVDNRLGEHERRINDHAIRIREIEMTKKQ